MNALYNKLEGMLDETLDENLVLTEIFAKLAQCPDQRVQNLLTWEEEEEEESMERVAREKDDDDDAMKKKRRSLATVMKSVWYEAKERVNEVDNFEEAIDAHRLRLGTMFEEKRDGMGGGGDGAVTTTTKGDSLKMTRTKVQSSFCEGECSEIVFLSFFFPFVHNHVLHVNILFFSMFDFSFENQYIYNIFQLFDFFFSFISVKVMSCWKNL